MDLLGCSGPGAIPLMAENKAIASEHVWVVCAVFLASVMVATVSRGSRTVPILVLVLLALHPAWSLHMGGGDCYYVMRNGSRWVSLIGFVALCWQTVQAIRPKAELSRLPGESVDAAV